MMHTTALNAGVLKVEQGIGGSKVERPVKHFSLNWHPSERPDQEEMLGAVQSFLKHMGWEEHQAILIAHTDKPYRHVHVVLNAIHPETGLKLDDGFERRRAQAWALAYEQEHGRIFCEQRSSRRPSGRRPNPARPGSQTMSTVSAPPRRSGEGHPSNTEHCSSLFPAPHGHAEGPPSRDIGSGLAGGVLGALEPRGPPPWRAAAAELLPARRAATPPRHGRYRLRGSRRLLRCREALILGEFAYRFHMAKQEVCPRARQATLARLAIEQQTALRQAREATMAEERSDREHRRSAGTAMRLVGAPRAGRRAGHDHSVRSANPFRDERTHRLYLPSLIEFLAHHSSRLRASCRR